MTKRDRQNWLDLFVAAQAYQVGVDTLDFRSEKRFANGRVVMEVRYERTAPDDDIFEVKFFDNNDLLVRSEHYTRDDVEDTYNFLFNISVKVEAGKQKQFEDQRESRWKAVAEYFPNAKSDSTPPHGESVE